MRSERNLFVGKEKQNESIQEQNIPLETVLNLKLLNMRYTMLQMPLFPNPITDRKQAFSCSIRFFNDPNRFN